MVTLRIAVSDDVLNEDDVNYLYLGKIAPDPGNMGPLHEWMPESIWPKVKALGEDENLDLVVLSLPQLGNFLWCSLLKQTIRMNTNLPLTASIRTGLPWITLRKARSSRMRTLLWMPL